MASGFAQSDFYLTASGLIPVLGLADLVIRRRYIALRNAKAVERLNRMAPWLELAGAVVFTLLLVFAEFACLRSLEIQKPAFAAPAIVWVALVYLAVQTVGFFVVDKLGAALPSRFLDREPPPPTRVWRDS